MTPIIDQIRHTALDILRSLYPQQTFDIAQIVVNETKEEFTGDYTLVLFPFVKSLKTNPNALGTSIGDAFVRDYPNIVTQYDIVAGFLNLSVSTSLLVSYLSQYHQGMDSILVPHTSTRKVMIEYSSPNTNKPIHFGHLRNNFLGWSVSEILKQQGHQVIKANLINDRGIHICKSMIAWQRYADGATPASTGIKGDHLVGDYYVRYNDVYKQEMQTLIDSGMDEKEAEKQAPIFLEAQEMLRQWEAGDPAVYALWQEMNGWVYDGFETTYRDLGIDFDQYYYESNTYLLGKEIVKQGLESGVLFTKDNGSVWIDLTDEGLDEKLLLRADGTSVYITQDLGTAALKYRDHGIDQSVYVIADEQNYHMQVLKAILTKLDMPYASGIHHLSYGMVELPTGRMKSREGTVVDADDMIAEMIAIAKAQTELAGKTEGFSTSELEHLYRTIGLGALKFYLLRVDPKKKMIFDPKESIDLHGYTATFIQYAYARIQSILRKHPLAEMPITAPLEDLERSLLRLLEQYPTVISQAADAMNPAAICGFVFKVAQTFNSFYERHSVAKAETDEKKQLRLQIAMLTAHTIQHSMGLLGIGVPERM